MGAFRDIFSFLQEQLSLLESFYPDIKVDFRSFLALVIQGPREPNTPYLRNIA